MIISEKMSYLSQIIFKIKMFLYIFKKSYIYNKSMGFKPYRNIMLNLNRAKKTCIALWRTAKCVSENIWNLGWGEMNLPQGHGKKELVMTIG